MFRKTRLRIFALIMSVSTIVIALMLTVVYIVNSRNSYERSISLLQDYIDDFSMEFRPDIEVSNTPPEYRPRPKDDRDRMFRLSTFYSVLYDRSGNAIRVNFNDGNVYSEQEVLEIADHVFADGDDEGTYRDMPYLVKDIPEGTIVAFIDNTMEIDNFNSLIFNCFAVGLSAWAVILLFAWFFSKKIVMPLEQNDIQQKQFVSDAGHELKTPISVISTNVELLALEMKDNKWLSNIQYENERMGELVKNLLDLARAENAESKKERLDFGYLVSGGVLPFEAVAYEKGITIDADIQDDIFIEGNQSQISQLVSILVDNAICHGSSGKEIHVKLYSSRKNVIFSVINAGGPISPEVQKRLFERFYREDEARTDESGHYGLGLAIAKAIVEAHGGRIEVCCYDNLVEFKVSLPKTKN